MTPLELKATTMNAMTRAIMDIDNATLAYITDNDALAGIMRGGDYFRTIYPELHDAERHDNETYADTSHILALMALSRTHRDG